MWLTDMCQVNDQWWLTKNRYRTVILGDKVKSSVLETWWFSEEICCFLKENNDEVKM